MLEAQEISCDPKVHRKPDQVKFPPIISQIMQSRNFLEPLIVVLLPTYLFSVNVNNCLFIALTKSNCAAIQGM